MKRTFIQRTPLAAAVLVAIGSSPVAAQEMLEIDDLVNPRSSITAGMGYIDKDNRFFGEYSGFVDYSDKGFAPLFDIDYVTRDNETGTWVKANAEVTRRGTFGAEFEKQGDWGASFDYQRITRQDPLSFNTGLTGRFTGTQQIAGRTLRDVDFRTERDDFRLDLKKEFKGGFGGRVMFREMQREGARNWGVHSNFGGPTAGFAFIAEPIDQKTRELEAEVGYTGDSLVLAGGVYGTSFDNAHKVVFNDSASQNEVSLPLDNSSMQLYLNGGYSFTPSTRLNFKVASTEATQDENFYQPSTRNGRTNLDGKIKTSLGYVGFSSRPMDKLSLTANLRYEDRKDETPIDDYISAGATRDGNNVPHSRKSTKGKLEVGYQIPMGFTVLGGLGWDNIERSSPPETSTAYADNEESSYRVELRRGMSETLNGAFSYTYRDRDTDDVRPSENSQTVWITPVNMADRKRDEWRLNLDWVPTEPLGVQFTYRLTDDEYGRISDYGSTSGESEVISLDASYMINDDWTVNGWVSRDTNNIKYNQAIGGTDWASDVEYIGDSIGLGVKGLVAWQHHVGADITYGKDKSKYGINDVGNAADDLPDIEYEYTRFNLYGDYVLDENSGIRADWIYTRYENDDWTWDDWDYLDGTTVELVDKETVNFVGVSFYYKWR